MWLRDGFWFDVAGDLSVLLLNFDDSVVLS